MVPCHAPSKLNKDPIALPEIYFCPFQLLCCREEKFVIVLSTKWHNGPQAISNYTFSTNHVVQRQTIHGLVVRYLNRVCHMNGFLVKSYIYIYIYIYIYTAHAISEVVYIWNLNIVCAVCQVMSYSMPNFIIWYYYALLAQHCVDYFEYSRFFKGPITYLLFLQ